MVLFVDGCVRKESRTRRLALALLEKLHDQVEQIQPNASNLTDLDEETLAKRSALCDRGDFSWEYFDLAKQFAAADTIVIAAPFWDAAFPAVVKRYIEQICVTGITFRYSAEGIPQGLCRAKKLYYVTTAGGPIYTPQFGYGYVETLAKQMFGIQECQCIACENLDIVGNDPEQMLKEKIAGLQNMQL